MLQVILEINKLINCSIFLRKNKLIVSWSSKDFSYYHVIKVWIQVEVSTFLLPNDRPVFSAGYTNLKVFGVDQPMLFLQPWYFIGMSFQMAYQLYLFILYKIKIYKWNAALAKSKHQEGNKDKYFNLIMGLMHNFENATL